MNMDGKLRRSFEDEIHELLEIANAKQQHHLKELVDYARLCWKHRQRGEKPTRTECLCVLQEQTKEARRFLDTWMDAGRSFARWRAANPELFSLITNTIQDTYYDVDRDDLNDEPTTERGYSLGEHVVRSRCLYDLHWLFFDLLRNPLRNDVMKCDRCLQWFLNRSGHRNKRFCKRRCAVLATVTRSQRRRRERERRAKINHAQAAIRDWNRKTNEDWKEWVCLRTGLTPKFLTRALNLGELKLPRL